MTNLPNRLGSFFGKVPDPVGRTNLTTRYSTPNKILTKSTPRGATMPIRASNSSPYLTERFTRPMLAPPGCSPTIIFPTQLAVNQLRARNPGLCGGPHIGPPLRRPVHSSPPQRSVYCGTNPCHRSRNFPPTEHGCNREGSQTSLPEPYLSKAQELLSMEADSQPQDPRQDGGDRFGHPDRRLTDRLGSFLPWEGSLRKRSQEEKTHHINLLELKAASFGFDLPSRMSCYKQTTLRQSAISTNLEAHIRYLYISCRRISCTIQCNGRVYTRQGEHNCRLPVPTSARVTTLPEDLQQDPPAYPNTPQGGPICITPQQSATEVCKLAPGPRCHGGECLRTGLAESRRALHVPSFDPHWQNPDQASQGENCISDTHIVSLAGQTMVATTPRVPHSNTTVPTPISITVDQPNRGLAPPLESPGNETTDMCLIGELLKVRRVPDRPIEVILKSWCTSTRKSYKSGCNAWVRRCLQRSIDPLDPSTNDLLTFLSDNFEAGKSSSWISTLRS